MQPPQSGYSQALACSVLCDAPGRPVRSPRQMSRLRSSGPVRVQSGSLLSPAAAQLSTRSVLTHSARQTHAWPVSPLRAGGTRLGPRHPCWRGGASFVPRPSFPRHCHCSLATARSCGWEVDRGRGCDKRALPKAPRVLSPPCDTPFPLQERPTPYQLVHTAPAGERWPGWALISGGQERGDAGTVA